MAYKEIPFEKRLKENIRHYRLSNLFKENVLQDYLHYFAKVLGLEVLLTERHGEKAVCYGSFAGYTPDVVAEPGIKIRVCGRTVGHLYIKWDGVAQERRNETEKLLEQAVHMMEALGEETYLHMESAAYVDELEAKLATGRRTVQYGEREDALTGVFNKIYFESRLEVIDRSEVVPVAVINANINDWSFVNRHYGEEESDRLIQTVAEILKNGAKQDYIIGRTDGDVFHIVIPMPEEGEAEEYCRRIGEACLAYEDAVLAPSVALGFVYKENVEEKLRDKLSDAEYEMFNHKIDMKNAPGYRERLEKGLKQKGTGTALHAAGN